MEAAPIDPVAELDARWREGRNRWGRKLGRLRLDAEPLDVQLDRYRKMTWGLSAVTGTIALMFVALFTAFRRPDIGLILVAILLLPVIVFGWIGYLQLALQASAFGKARDAYEAERRRLTESASATDAAPKST